MIETEKLRKQREARLAAEALFEPMAEPSAAQAPTVVTVRQRRSASVVTAPDVPALNAASNEDATRPPRVHLVVPETTAPLAEPAPAEVSTPVQSTPAPVLILEDQAPVVAPDELVSADAMPARPSKEPRKVRPTVPRPSVVVQSSAAGREVRAIRKTPAPRRTQVTKSTDEQAANVEIPRTSGFEGYEWPLYPKLITQIEELKRQAHALRERESAEAILWIKEAIALHGLSAQDLGFHQSRR